MLQVMNKQRRESGDTMAAPPGPHSLYRRDGTQAKSHLSVKHTFWIIYCCCTRHPCSGISMFSWLPDALREIKVTGSGVCMIVMYVKPLEQITITNAACCLPTLCRSFVNATIHIISFIFKFKFKEEAD